MRIRRFTLDDAEVWTSDTQLHNTASIATHAALGFVETDRVVQFVKAVTRYG